MLIPVRVTPDVRHRFKLEAAKLGLTYSELIERMLDTRRELERRERAKQPSPLHRPRETTQL